MFYVGKEAIYFEKQFEYDYVAKNISEIQIPKTCKKLYAIKKGKISCICFNWEKCKSLVLGVPNAEYKSFKDLFDAIKYIFLENIVEEDKNNKDEEIIHPECFAYVDGSYNDNKKIYGYGVVLSNKNLLYEYSGTGNNEEMLSMRNVSGEILGAMRAINEAIKFNIKEITIYYDYKGIECWATGEWQRNKFGTKVYYDFIQSVKDEIKVNFVKVKAHSGVELNEIVDKLAKQSVGIE